MTMQSTQNGEQLKVTNEGLSPSSIKTIVLADGEHQISDGELVQFAVGQANSPIEPPKTYPYLRYRDVRSGRTCWTALRQIVSFSSE